MIQVAPVILIYNEIESKLFISEQFYTPGETEISSIPFPQLCPVQNPTQGTNYTEIIPPCPMLYAYTKMYVSISMLINTYLVSNLSSLHLVALCVYARLLCAHLGSSRWLS